MRFRAYFIDDNEHVRAAVDLKAANETEALERAAGLRDHQTVEVWEISGQLIGWDRLLKRFEPHRKISKPGFW
jgi:hypothetical protein